MNPSVSMQSIASLANLESLDTRIPIEDDRNVNQLNYWNSTEAPIYDSMLPFYLMDHSSPETTTSSSSGVIAQELEPEILERIFRSETDCNEFESNLRHDPGVGDSLEDYKKWRHDLTSFALVCQSWREAAGILVWSHVILEDDARAVRFREALDNLLEPPWPIRMLWISDATSYADKRHRIQPFEDHSTQEMIRRLAASTERAVDIILYNLPEETFPELVIWCGCLPHGDETELEMMWNTNESWVEREWTRLDSSEHSLPQGLRELFRSAGSDITRITWYTRACESMTNKGLPMILIILLYEIDRVKFDLDVDIAYRALKHRSRPRLHGGWGAFVILTTRRTEPLGVSTPESLVLLDDMSLELAQPLFSNDDIHSRGRIGPFSFKHCRGLHLAAPYDRRPPSLYENDSIYFLFETFMQDIKYVNFETEDGLMRFLCDRIPRMSQLKFVEVRAHNILRYNRQPGATEGHILRVLLQEGLHIQTLQYIGIRVPSNHVLTWPTSSCPIAETRSEMVHLIDQLRNPPMIEVVVNGVSVKRPAILPRIKRIQLRTETTREGIIEFLGRVSDIPGLEFKGGRIALDPTPIPLPTSFSMMNVTY